MASVWDPSPLRNGNRDPLPRHRHLHSGDQHHHRRRNSWMVAAVIVSLGLVGTSYGALRIWDNIKHPLGGNFLKGIGQGLQRFIREDQSGGTAANAAAWSAAPQPPGSLTVVGLNAALPQYQWVDGATNVTHAAKRPVVSMSANGTHIETAVAYEDGFCSFGLTITSSTDPLTSQDHVEGLGKFYHLVGSGTYWQTVYQAPQCAADEAPSSGWISWPRSLNNLMAPS